jgi:uncharacterized membrane protein YdjX (TVP38/TMEM64 family)
MVSSLIGFYLGRLAGARTLRTFSGQGLRQFIDLVGRNGFFASLIVRLVPSAPFIVVNMAAGVTPMRVVDFAAGTGLGIIPKIALTCFAGNSVARMMKGQGGAGHIAGIVAVIVIWLGIGWFARRWLKAREAQAAAETGD